MAAMGDCCLCLFVCFRIVPSTLLSFLAMLPMQVERVSLSDLNSQFHKLASKSITTQVTIVLLIYYYYCFLIYP